jgi:hypothetical protein
MHFTSLALIASGMAFASAAPAAAPAPFALDDPLPTTYTLYVTFWEKGCQDPSDTDGNIATFTVNEVDETADRPGDCVQLTAYGWQSINILQPTDEAKKYSIEIFSGLGCNNPLLVSLSLCAQDVEILTWNLQTVEDSMCYTQPEGQMVQSFRANLL